MEIFLYELAMLTCFVWKVKRLKNTKIRYKCTLYMQIKVIFTLNNICSAYL